MDLRNSVGLRSEQEAADPAERERLLRYMNLQLVAHGFPGVLEDRDAPFVELASGLLENYREQTRLLAEHRCPVDRRIENFLREHFADVDLPFELRLPNRTLVLDRHGLAREFSLPVDGDEFSNGFVTSYRVKNGVLHNPVSDRRTTKGTFHVCEGGLSIPGDKIAVPKAVFAKMLHLAWQPPEELLLLPFTASKPQPAHTFVSLLLRPLVCPDVPGVCPRKTMEVRFFVPGSFVSNLDFVESIFGNAGDPFIPENDAGLDVEHWTGHTGVVILAPHLNRVKKKEVGLPHYDQATSRQRRDGMCWRDEDELYNDGSAFKMTCRNEAGVIITLISDNYFGYCKKEVKTQISYAANLFGNVEEEHAGGTLAFASYNLGEEFQVNSTKYNGRTFADVVHDFADAIDVQLEGYGIDKFCPDLIYIPENAFAHIAKQSIEWTRHNAKQSIPLLPGKTYMAPSGYKLRLEKHPASPTWRLIGTVGEGVFCHKPCTVSGGGKSEISKSLVDYMLYGPLFVADIEADLAAVDAIFERDYSTRWRVDIPECPDYSKRPSRPVLSSRRSLGSVIKLLTPSRQYTDEYNDWLASIPNHIYAMALIIKRFQRPGWTKNWREHFGVDIVNGEPGHELKYRERKLVGTYLRVGLRGPKTWRTFKLRQDFAASSKVQTEDDISASVVVPVTQLSRLAAGEFKDVMSVKFAVNCEYRLFQRPDDAIYRGLDKQTELDLTRPDNFLSNFEPLSRDHVEEMTRYVIDFDAFSQPMQRLLHSFLESEAKYVVCSANPREIDGRISKNPRYLQTRPDLARPMERYIGEQGVRLYRGIPQGEPLHLPVNSVLFGRRNNPPDSAAGIRGLAVYNPIHYQELPELFMDFVCSLTGKSPSTTGFGSEGALTKGPFNSLQPTADLNTALVSFILTKLGGFATAAGHIGPNSQVDHDISLLIPEVWCRLSAEERDPEHLIAEGLLEPLRDFEHQGETILASRLGYRITDRFVRRYFARIFDNPAKVFDDLLLKPELQDREAFIDGIKYITDAHQQVAQGYLDDGSVKQACPPLQALLHIMATGEYEGRTIQDESIRSMFTRDYLLSSTWYQERLCVKQQRDVALWRRHLKYLDELLAQPKYQEVAERLELAQRRRYAHQELERVQSAKYLESLVGTLGADPLQPVANHEISAHHEGRLNAVTS